MFLFFSFLVPLLVLVHLRSSLFLFAFILALVLLVFLRLFLALVFVGLFFSPSSLSFPSLATSVFLLVLLLLPSQACRYRP